MTTPSPSTATQVLIIIPTYNEMDNLARIVPAIQEVLPEAHILVVDDRSPDGTGDLAERLAARDTRIHVTHGEGKQGLGVAYIRGFRWALERDYELIFQMDADFSHQPRFLPAFLERIESNDLVLGARYIPGGGTENWSLKRRMLSRGGNIYARTVLGLRYLHDITGGFKCFRREVLASIDLDNIQQKGFGFQIELTWRAHLQGFRIAEVPIVFPDRAEGESKMSGTIFKEALLGVFKLRRLKRRLTPRPPEAR